MNQLKKATDFLKYNNLTVLILAMVFIASTGVFAATETGQEMIGGKEVREEGTDNTVLLAVDLSSFSMDYTIERIESDDKYYYVIYTCLDLVQKDNAWQMELAERTRKVSRSLRQDLGLYLAEEFAEEQAARLAELAQEQERARATGEETRTEVTEYGGLIGSTLDLASRIFTNYEPVKARIIPSPELPAALLAGPEPDTASAADNMADIYNDYIAANDPDKDNFFGETDNCPLTANPDQKDTDGDGVGDACDTDENSAPAVEPVTDNPDGETATGSPADTTGDDGTPAPPVQPEQTAESVGEESGNASADEPAAGIPSTETDQTPAEPEVVEVVELPQ